MHTLIFTGVVNFIESITQNRNQINYLQNRITTKTQHNGSFFLHKSSVSIDLVNLPPLPDARKQSMMICEIPNDFFCQMERIHN